MRQPRGRRPWRWRAVYTPPKPPPAITIDLLEVLMTTASLGYKSESRSSKSETNRKPEIPTQTRPCPGLGISYSDLVRIASPVLWHVLLWHVLLWHGLPTVPRPP